MAFGGKNAKLRFLCKAAKIEHVHQRLQKGVMLFAV
jgi:hypothetical protein